MKSIRNQNDEQPFDRINFGIKYSKRLFEKEEDREYDRLLIWFSFQDTHRDRLIVLKLNYWIIDIFVCQFNGLTMYWTKFIVSIQLLRTFECVKSKTVGNRKMQSSHKLADVARFALSLSLHFRLNSKLNMILLLSSNLFSMRIRKHFHIHHTTHVHNWGVNDWTL